MSAPSRGGRLAGAVARNRAVHFVVLGALLYGGTRVATRTYTPAVARTPVVVDAARIEELATGYARQAGKPPTRAQLEGLITQAVDDDLLYREARVTGLDVGDRSVRLRLVQKMRAVSDDPTLDDDALERAARTFGFDDDLVIRRMMAGKMRLVLVGSAHAAPPDDAELQAWLEAHRADYEMPATVSFTQVYLADGGHGKRLPGEAAALLGWLRAADPPAEIAAQRSDPFVLGPTMRARSAADLARLFGRSFADAVMALPPGRWSGPVASPYGLHLVRIDEQRPAALPPLLAVRRQLRLAVEEAHAVAELQAGLAKLRTLYEVRIDEPSIDAALASAARTPPAPLASAQSLGE
jgi:hypothetical protein